MKRNMRISIILKTLTDYPGKVFTLSYFSELLGAAKSSLSEDLIIVKSIFNEMKKGRVETITGAAGGVVLLPHKDEEFISNTLDNVARSLMDPKRHITGGFIYYADILNNPHLVKDLGEIIASRFSREKIDYVMTIETKGISLALMVAYFLNVPMIVARKDNKLSEGSTVSINYESGSTGKLSHMYVAKRSIKNHSRILIVDDFLKGGGTVRGMVDLAKEFDSEIIGVAVFIDAITPGAKMYNNYISLLQLIKDSNGETIIKRNDKI
jgi:purine operon repressor